MSRPDVVYWGEVPLKPGVTPAQIIALVREQWGPETDQTQLPFDQPNKHGDWTPPADWNLWGDIHLTFSPGSFHYNFTGNWTWDFDEEQFQPWIAEVTKLAAGAWESREGDEDEEVMIIRGPDELTIAQFEVQLAEHDLKQAKERLETARSKLKEMEERSK